jgi:two-component system, OmpR family, phosphate regulon sensor histidine kinase PhoR
MKQKRLIWKLLFEFALCTAFTAFIVAADLPRYLTMLWLVVFPVVFAFRLNRYILHPLKDLMDVADNIAHKDPDARMPIHQNWQISLLAEFVNYSLDKMSQNIARERASRDRLQMILSSIEDALWVQNSEGLIELTNPVFRELFLVAESEPKAFCWEIIRIPEILRIIQEISSKETTRISEFSMDGHDYMISGSVNKQTKDAIFILQNIDELKATQKMKRDFALNVAHELRTPLTAIKGFVDILHDEDPENRYLKIIQRHNTRLIALVSDLEELARLERSPQLDIQDISVSTFFQNIYGIYENSLNQKGLQLILDINPQGLRAKLDPYRMEQVFINLIDNALRYTKTGEIRISAAEAGDDIEFVVSDTGVGIPKQHLNRVFERFYTVDPSRSRENSGTGLGLAIVKHIVNSHQGRIRVSSSPSAGTSFNILIPQTDE